MSEQPPDFVVEHMDPRSLAENPFQFRLHPDRQRLALNASVAEFGLVDGPLVNKRTMHLIDGHLRVEEAIKAGRETMPVKVVDLSEEQERRLLRVFDPLTMLAEEDTAALDALIAEIDDAGLERLLGTLEEVPAFEPVGEDEQGRLDEKASVECPSCGHRFTP